MEPKRVQFDSSTFSNGDGFSGLDFRLGIDGDDNFDEALADSIIRDMQLLMVVGVAVWPHEDHQRAVQARVANGLRDA